MRQINPKGLGVVPSGVLGYSFKRALGFSSPYVSPLPLSWTCLQWRECSKSSVSLWVLRAFSGSLQPADGALAPRCCSTIFLQLCVCVCVYPVSLQHSCSHPWRDWPLNSSQGHRAEYQPFSWRELMSSAGRFKNLARAEPKLNISVIYLFIDLPEAVGKSQPCLVESPYIYQGLMICGSITLI